MADTLHVFISATTGDLGTVRELVKQGLLTMHCLPVEQANFTPDYREVAAMLEERIRGCEAVIHLVGLRYGAEPDPASLPAGAPRRSFTQMEADLARRLGKKLYVFLCPEDFPYDPCAPEPEDLATLQRAYRQEITTRPTRHTPVRDREDVARRILELQLDPDKKRADRMRHWHRSTALASGLALVLAALAISSWRLRHTAGVVQTPADASSHGAGTAQSRSYDPQRIRQNISALTHRRAKDEIAELEPARDWEKIATLKETRDRQLADVDRFLEGIARAFQKKEASADFATASRILADQSAEEAFRFLESKSATREAELEVLMGTHGSPQQVREFLREKLLAAALLEKDSQFDRAEAEYRAVARDGGAWPEPRNRLAWVLGQDVIGPEPTPLNVGRLREAAGLCRETVDLISRETEPIAWSDSQIYLGDALRDLGVSVEEAEGLPLLDEAVAAYRAALQVRTQEKTPLAWAMTQSHIGQALVEHGNRAEGADPPKLLNEAVTAYRAALEVYTKQRSPLEWAQTQHALGEALWLLSMELSDSARERSLLLEAVAAFRAALQVRTRESTPDEWAKTQIGLGYALSGLSFRMEGAERLLIHDEEIAAYRVALEVYARKDSPQDWARTQDSLASALMQKAGYMEMDTKVAEVRPLLKEAAAIYAAVLEIYTREHVPKDWARTQDELGSALAEQGDVMKGAEGERILEQAVVAYRAALVVRTREQMQDEWGQTMGRLGDVLRKLSERVGGATLGSLGPSAESQRLLREAVAANKACLEVHTPKRDLWWEWKTKDLLFDLEILALQAAPEEAARLRAEAENIERELHKP